MGLLNQNTFDKVTNCGVNASTNDVLLEAGKMGTAREIYEETGIDLRFDLNRLVPVPLRLGQEHNSGTQLNCELKRRLYFYVDVKYSDFLCGNEVTSLCLYLTSLSSLYFNITLIPNIL